MLYRGEVIMFEACITIGLVFTVAMQWFIVLTYKEKFNKITKALNTLEERKADKGHKHDHSYIGGNMDMVFQGKRASVQAHIYPKRVNYRKKELE